VGFFVNQLTNGQAAIHYGRHRLTASSTTWLPHQCPPRPLGSLSKTKPCQFNYVARSVRHARLYYLPSFTSSESESVLDLWRKVAVLLTQTPKKVGRERGNLSFPQPTTVRESGACRKLPSPAGSGAEPQSKTIFGVSWAWEAHSVHISLPLLATFGRHKYTTAYRHRDNRNCWSDVRLESKRWCAVYRTVMTQIRLCF